MITTGLYEKVEQAMKKLSFHSDSLLYCLTNDAAESFNALVAVHIGGKRINFSLKNQYNARVYAAVIRQNTQQLLTEMHQKFYDKVSSVILDYEKQRKEKIKKKRDKRRANGRKRKYKVKKQKGEKYYGPRSEEVDKTDEQMETAKAMHFEWLQNNQQNLQTIHNDTLGEQNWMKWTMYQKKYLTPPHYGPIICSRDSTSCQKILKVYFVCHLK